MITVGRNGAFQLPVETTEMYGVFSPDRSRLLTGGDGREPKVHIWDVETGNALQVFTGHREPVAALAWAADQRWVASGAFDRCVRVWDVGSGECLRVLDGHRSYVRSVDFSRSREQLLLGSGDGVVRLWELSSGKRLQEFRGHTDGVYRAIFDASQTRILSGGRDRTIRLWEVSSGRCLRVIDAPGVHVGARVGARVGGHVQCLVWHSDGTRFLSCAGELRLWDSRLASACGCGTGTRTRFEPRPGVETSIVFCRPPMTARCEFGSQRRRAAFKCSRDMRSALSTPFGRSTRELSFPATRAADSDGGHESILASIQLSSGCVQRKLPPPNKMGRETATGLGGGDEYFGE